MKVSIIIPYDIDRGFLNEALKSCNNQYGFYLGIDYEVIQSQDDEPIGININRGVVKAKGEFIKICAEDDLLLPHCLYHLYKAATINALDFVCADALNFDSYTGKVIQTVKSKLPVTVGELAFENTIHGGTCLYRKATMPKWTERYETAEEYDLALRMADAGLRFGYTPHLVYKYRIWSQNKSGSANREERHYDQRERIIQKYYWSTKKVNIPH